MAKRMSIDIGGTFTDLVAVDEDTGKILLGKDPTTPEDFAKGVMNAIDKSDADPQSISQFVHGTTVVINALTERSGQKTALITTKGFRDVLEIQRANRPDMYNLFYRKPKPFVPRRYRFEVSERLNSKGEELKKLDEKAVRKVAQTCKEKELSSIAVCFIHSYVNPAHEKRVKEIIEDIYPEAFVTLSHELTQEWREYERTNTTVLNSYVKPITHQYLKSLEERLEGCKLTATRFAMQSNGGTATFDQAKELPIHLIESGPVGGAIGASVLGETINESNIISFDMGGTTAKVSLIENGDMKINTEYHIEKSAKSAGYPIRIPVVDIVEVGAGGGSIGWIDKGGAINVGPRSAGATPGPACYSLGGTQPTVTDANLLTGRLNSDYFLGGEMKLSVKKAKKSMEEIASHFNIDETEAAHGILRVTNANMLGALERVSIERGHDPRDFTMVAYGGAGGLHGPGLARELNMKKVIIPQAPGQFSAWGMLMTNLRHDLIRTMVMSSSTEKVGQMNKVFDEMNKEATARLKDEGFTMDLVTTDLFLDLRYKGQEHTVRTPADHDRLSEQNLPDIMERFHKLHNQAYSFRLDDPVEVVNFHLVAWGQVEKPSLEPLSEGGKKLSEALKGEREVDFEEEMLITDIYERDKLPVGAEINGPALVEEPVCTTIIYPDQKLTVDNFGNLVIEEVS